jgi:hypothetical protein
LGLKIQDGTGGEIRDKVLWMQMYYSWEAECVKQW